MRIVGDTIYIQRGETWSLDFELTDMKGRPYMLYTGWRNPHLVITMSNSLYRQEGDSCDRYWMSLAGRYEEDVSGEPTYVYTKTFGLTDALYLPNGFNGPDILAYYGETVMNNIYDFLFCTEDANGELVYKMVSKYRDIEDIEWVEYSFRVAKQFFTEDWHNSEYYYDVKILCGDTVADYTKQILGNLWSGYEDLETNINRIEDENEREYVLNVFNSGAPLMPNYDVVSVIETPRKICVGTDIQGGV